jgi:hypothetical protein
MHHPKNVELILEELAWVQAFQLAQLQHLAELKVLLKEPEAEEWIREYDATAYVEHVVNRAWLDAEKTVQRSDIAAHLSEMPDREVFENLLLQMMLLHRQQAGILQGLSDVVRGAVPIPPEVKLRVQAYYRRLLKQPFPGDLIGLYPNVK